MTKVLCKNPWAPIRVCRTTAEMKSVSLLRATILDGGHTWLRSCEAMEVEMYVHHTGTLNDFKVDGP